jgi:hypothetical protein
VDTKVERGGHTKLVLKGGTFNFTISVLEGGTNNFEQKFDYKRD